MLQTLSKKSTPEYFRQYRRGLPGRLTTAAYNARTNYPEAKVVTSIDLLGLFLRQGGHCALTNEPFTEASEISLDHVLPRHIVDETAANDLSNLALVQVNENKSKRERTLFAYFADKIEGSWYDEGEVPAHVWRGRTVADVVAYYDGINAAEGRLAIKRFELLDRMLTDHRFIEHGVISYATEVTVVNGQLQTKTKFDELTWRLAV
ncbi:hypothetical protein ACQR3P_31855 [Rhodococcus sp. IEGM1300]